MGGSDLTQQIEAAISTLEYQEHGERVTGNDLFVKWLGPWFIGHAFWGGAQWMREYGEYDYPVGKIRTHKGPKVPA